MRKHLTARQERARELGRMDAANRCVFCKRALIPGHVMLLSGVMVYRYCDDACVRDHEDARKVMEARR